MGIFDKIKYKKDEKGETVEKVEKSESSQLETNTVEVDKAAKVAPTQEKAKNQMSKEVTLMSGVILRPVITEKSAHLATENKYVFQVRQDATRVDVKTAIKSMYGVLPVNVRIMNKIGKKIRFGQREGKRKDWKKATVTLPKGSSINVYEGV